MMQAPVQPWDEDAATVLVGSWLARIGAGWPAGLSVLGSATGKAWDRWQKDMDRAFAEHSWEALYASFQAFRMAVSPAVNARRR